MGRFYEVSVTPAPTSSSPQPAPLRKWTSVGTNGQDNPGALNVQLDLLIYPASTPMGSSTITVEGVALEDIRQAQQFANMTLQIKGGMSAGLPLADPTQAGLLLQGSVFQSFGNWIGNDMTLSFVANASLYTYDTPGNIVLIWRKGDTLAASLANTLKIAYPDLGQPKIQIGQYVNSSDVVHAVRTFSDLGQMVNSITGGKVQMTIQNNVVLVYDGSVAQSPKELRFIDLIGQPTWIQPNVMQFATTMRADIQVGQLVKMPAGLQDAPGIIQTTAASTPSQLKYKVSFQGSFVIQSVRHIGNFRDPSGASWATVFQAATLG